MQKVDFVYAGKGKKVTQFDLAADRPDDEILLQNMLGATGNLRAPMLLIGRVLLVGFNLDTFKTVLG